MNKRDLKPGDVLPSHVLRDEFGFNADHRPTIVVDERQVPDALRPLIPYAERWAIADDVICADYIERQSPVDVAAFWQDLLPHVDAIQRWLDSLPRDVTAWPAAAVHFMYLLRAHDRAYQPTEAEREQAKARHQAWERSQRRDQAIEQATRAFQAKDWSATVELLAPFEADLDKIMKAKLDFARKQRPVGR